jgi:hypothetical protein
VINGAGAAGNNGLAATVSGGVSNYLTGSYSVIAGGFGNTNSGEYAVIGGGYQNFISNPVSARAGATISGGYENIASGPAATVGGGSLNTASGNYATVVGGHSNTASGVCATASGAGNTASGGYSFAAGNLALATNGYSFVWSDGTAATGDTNADQFVARASGGFYFYTSSGPTGAQLPSGSGSWSSMSDRNSKDGFTTVNPETVLASVSELPMTTWSYKAEHGVRHIGPMAQDFYAAFNVGEDDRHIADVDEGGVALAAIQGLNQKLEDKMQKVEAENADLKRQNDALSQRLDEVERTIKEMAGRN